VVVALVTAPSEMLALKTRFDFLSLVEFTCSSVKTTSMM